MGAEALIRWNSAALGFVMPGAFIGIAEETGMIVQIGRYVLQTVVGDILRGKVSAYGENLTINVNLSVKQLLNDQFLSELEMLIRESGIDPKMLTLEVTESVLIFDVDMIVERLARIRALGIRIALDDFGTGYSSLNNLRALPLDIVKIDRSFVSRLGIDQYSTLFIQTIINLAHSLGLKVCAEGIETKEQFLQLREDGCDTVQGFYFSRPVPFYLFEKNHLRPLLKAALK